MAVITDEIAKIIVSDANAKEFEGKKEVKAKNMNLKSSSFDIKTNQVVHKKVEQKSKKTRDKNSFK